MPRPATGSVIPHKGKDGRTYRSLRFRAYGNRYTQPLGVVSEADAEKKLEHLMADIERGIWTPPTVVEPPPEAPAVPTFHEFAAEWWTLSEGQWSANTRADYRWRLEAHLLPFFEAMTVDQITGAVVKRYVAEKIAEGQRIREAAENGKPLMQDYTDRHGRECTRALRALSSRSINMTVTLLGAILDAAIDDDDLGSRMPRNAARGRRIKERAPSRTYLDTAAQIAALLDAAGELDRTAPRDRRHVQRRAMIATLMFAGLRISELLGLHWRDVDIAGGWLTVAGTKTDEADRRVKMRGALRDELLAVRSQGHVDQDAYVFPTRTGARLSPENFRNRVLAAAVKRANERLTERDLAPLPKLTPHSLRRTFCSLLYALGESPPVVMAEMGHTDPALALRVYAQAMRRDEHQQAQLRALVESVDWANMGERGVETACEEETAAQ
jgi:integrase